MADLHSYPLLTQRGVTFTITVNAKHRKCLITEEALHELSAVRNIDTSDANAMEIFHAFEGTVVGMARKLGAQNESDSLLVLTPRCFSGRSSGPAPFIQ